MKTSCARTVLLAASILAAMPLAAASGIENVSARIDYSDTDKAVAAIEELSGQLSGVRAAYLELTIVPAIVGDKPDYRASYVDDDDETVDFACADGFGRVSEQYWEIGFRLNEVYNHLLLSVNLRDAEAGASLFVSVACEYDTSVGEHPVLTVKGYFAVDTISIPTAHDIELKPFAPALSP